MCVLHRGSLQKGPQLRAELVSELRPALPTHLRKLPGTQHQHLSAKIFGRASYTQNPKSNINRVNSVLDAIPEWQCVPIITGAWDAEGAPWLQARIQLMLGRERRERKGCKHFIPSIETLITTTKHTGRKKKKPNLQPELIRLTIYQGGTIFSSEGNLVLTGLLLLRRTHNPKFPLWNTVDSKQLRFQDKVKWARFLPASCNPTFFLFPLQQHVQPIVLGWIGYWWLSPLSHVKPEIPSAPSNIFVSLAFL